MRDSVATPARRAPEVDPRRDFDRAGDGSPPSGHLPGLDHRPTTVVVPISGRSIVVGLARERVEFEQAFRLLAVNYQARGYDGPGPRPFRFTPFHVLPDTTTFVAKDVGKVVATLSLVPDTRLLGLPMESIFGPEVEALRREGRRTGEVTGLADRDLSPREFLPVFMAPILIRPVKAVLDAWAGSAHDVSVPAPAVNRRPRNSWS